MIDDHDMLLRYNLLPITSHSLVNYYYLYKSCLLPAIVHEHLENLKILKCLYKLFFCTQSIILQKFPEGFNLKISVISVSTNDKNR